MMVKPSITDLLKKVDNRYELVVATAKRARQLSKGDKPLTMKEEESKVTLAADEIAEGKVTIVRDEIVEDYEMAEDEIEEVMENEEVEEEE